MNDIPHFRVLDWREPEAEIRTFPDTPEPDDRTEYCYQHHSVLVKMK